MSQTRLRTIRGAAKRLGISADDYMAHLERGEKWCQLCREWHPRAAFGKNAANGDGLQGYCRDSANRRYREEYSSNRRPSEPVAFHLDRSLVDAYDADGHPNAIERVAQRFGVPRAVVVATITASVNEDLGLRPPGRPRCE